MNIAQNYGNNDLVNYFKELGYCNDGESNQNVADIDNKEHSISKIPSEKEELHEACTSESRKSIFDLLEKGFDMNKHNNDGETALHAPF